MSVRSWAFSEFMHSRRRRHNPTRWITQFIVERGLPSSVMGLLEPMLRVLDASVDLAQPGRPTQAQSQSGIAEMTQEEMDELPDLVSSDDE